MKNNGISEVEFVTTHNKEFLKKDILFNLDFENITLNPQLYSTIYYIMPKYFNDPFYHDAFVELFPDYEKMVSFSRFADKIPSSFHGKLQDVNIDNLSEKLVTSIDHSIFDKITSVESSFKTLTEGLSILYNFDKEAPEVPAEKLKEIEQYYPNFGLLKKLLSNPDFVSKINNSSFQDKSGYSEFSKELITLAYKEKLAEIEDLKKEIQALSAEHKTIEQEEKTEESFEKLYPQKEQNDKEKMENEQELQELTSKIKELYKENDEHNLIVNPESRTIFQKIRNFFSRIFNRGKIKNSEMIIASNTEQIKFLLDSQKHCKEKISEATRKNTQTEIEFKKASGKEITLEQFKKQKDEKSNSESENQNQNQKQKQNPSPSQSQNQNQNQNYQERKEKIKKKIQKLSSTLSIKESEMKELIDTGLVEDEILNSKQNEDFDKNSHQDSSQDDPGHSDK